jgi:hypothetical protein
MNFIPEQSEVSKQEVPFFDDVVAEEGWQGHTTSKSIATLKTEVIVALNRLGGTVMVFQRGIFVIGQHKREGFQVHYQVDRNGVINRGRLDVAALPVREDYRLNRSLNKRKEKSLKMALYMLRSALEGTWFLQQLSPGYAPLMPWMLTEQGKTVTQLWSEHVFTQNLLPTGDFVEGEIIKND